MSKEVEKNIDIQEDIQEDFEIIFNTSESDNTQVVTVPSYAERMMSEALQKYDASNSMYSVLLKTDGSNDELTLDKISDLSKDPQSSLKKVKDINAIVKKQINENYLVGRVVSAVEDNINSNFRLSYDDFSSQRNKEKSLEKTKLILNNFNKSINIESLIRKAISTPYYEGNYIMYLRNKNNNWIIDFFPLGVAEISDYEVNGKPVVIINIKELETRISKTSIKTKNGKALFFGKVADEIKENYPEEVYTAYKNKEAYAKLNIENTGVVRIGNLNMKYGITPIFKALKSLVVLDTFDKTNLTTSKSKAKKIVVQYLKKELLSKDPDVDCFEQMSFAHDALMQAWKQPTVVYTPPVFVDKVEYVEPKAEVANEDLINLYQSRVLTSLGIGFLSNDKNSSASIANIGLDQLMLTINKISQQVESVIEDFYRVVLSKNRIKEEFLPSIKILDSEQMSYDLKVSLATLLYGTLNCSLDTTLDILGFNSKDEVQKRIYENNNDYSEIFTPRQTSYTASGNSGDSGRPSDKSPNDPDKQKEDKINRK